MYKAVDTSGGGGGRGRQGGQNGQHQSFLIRFS